MKIIDALLSRGRVIVATVLCLALAGFASWLTMPRQEDPEMIPRWGNIVMIAPGFDAGTLERRVAIPVERELMQVEAVGHVEMTLRTGTLVALVELEATTPSFPNAWTQVREAIAAVQEDLPPEVGAAVLDDQTVGTSIAILALTGGEPGDLRAAARRLQQRLQRIPGTRRVEIELDPGEMIVVPLAPQVALAHKLPPELLAEALSEAGAMRPAGSLDTPDRVVQVEFETDLVAAERIARLPVRLPTGETIEVGALGTPARQAADPVREAGRWNGETAVFVSVTARSGVHAVHLGEAIEAAVNEMRAELAPTRVETMLLQSEHVERRLSELTRSLGQGILILAILLLGVLGLRAGALVAFTIPIVVLVSLGIYAAAGGSLHQISIAALVLALGLVVDNAIVLTEAVVRRVNEGVPPFEAARRATRELAMPLFAATGTTIAAFVPMLLATGDTAAFTGAIPVVVMLSLATSWVIAVTFVPAVAQAIIRAPRRPIAGPRRPSPLPRLAGIAAVRFPWVVLVVAGTIVGVTLAQAGRIGQQFFPASDRSTVVVDLALPEGTPFHSTDSAVADLSDVLLAREDVRQLAASTGRSLPRFYYNVIGVEAEPHRAQLAVDAHDPRDRDAIRAAVREWAESHPEVQVIDRILAQGPPTGAPIEVRLFGEDSDTLVRTAGHVRALVDGLPASRNARHDAGPGIVTLRAEADDVALARHGLDRAALARALQYGLRGLPAGEIYEDDERIPIVVRTPEGPRLDPSRLADLPLYASTGEPFPLHEVVDFRMGLTDAVIYRRNQQRRQMVRAELADGALVSDVAGALRRQLPEIVPAGVTWELGGEAEGADEASTAVLRALPFGVALLLFFLLVQFNSIRRLAIIAVTVPLAAVGVIPGLLLLDQPFGFMSLLGVLAVIGIVVNNAIVLISVTDDERRAGLSVEEAIRAGLDRRWRAVLLTTGTTILGILPLALTPSPLWPPLATAMISGIGASAALTLLVVPALYRLLASGPLPGGGPARPSEKEDRGGRPAGVAVLPSALMLLIAVGLIGASTAAASEGPSRAGVRAMHLSEAIEAAATTPEAAADAASVRAIRHEAAARTREGRRPILGMRAEAIQRSQGLALSTPAGDLTLESQREVLAGAEIVAPLVRIADQVDRPRAAHDRLRAAERESARNMDDRRIEAADAWLMAWSIPHEQELLSAQAARLGAARDHALQLAEAGAGLRQEVDRLELALADIEGQQMQLQRARRMAEEILGLRTGHEGPVRAVGALPALETLPQVRQESEARGDIEAALLRSAAARNEARAMTRDSLPELRGEGRWRWSSRGDLEDPHRFEAALVLAWTPWTGGARRAAAEALAAEADAWGYAAEAELRAAALQRADARTALEAAIAEEAVRERALQAARRQLAAVSAQRTEGAGILLELLDAEAALREAEQRLLLVRVERVRAALHLDWAGD